MNAAPTLTFLGATGTVTGSKYLLEANGLRVRVDCGLFQGRKLLRQRNWQALPFDAASLDAVLMTHAHLDHSGYLPVLRKSGFTGPVYCTFGTAALAHILLRDSGHLQEEDARYAAPVCIGIRAVFAADAFAGLKAAGAADIVTCNTIEHTRNAIDLKAALADGVRDLLETNTPRLAVQEKTT